MGKKKEVDLKSIRTKQLLEETVLCSKLGRKIASYGATLTGREKHNARVFYLLLKSGRKVPKTSVATARISKVNKTKKKYTSTEAMNWFIDRYPIESKNLVKRLEQIYTSKVKSLEYGLNQGEDFSDERYVETLVDVAGVSKGEASVWYHGALKPQDQKMKEEEGMVSMNMEQS